MPTLEEPVAYLEGKMEPDMRAEMMQRFDRLEVHIDSRVGEVDARLLALDQKVDRHFTRVVGIQLTMMITLLGVFAAAYFH